MPAFINLTGQTFGDARVIRWLGQRGPGGKVRYRCECRCGNRFVTLGELLRNGKVRSCGCLRRSLVIARNKAGALDLTPGERSGRLTVRAFSHSAPNGKWWICSCACGGTTTVLASAFRKGRVRSCGCLARGGETYTPRRGPFAGKLFRTLDAAMRLYPSLVPADVKRSKRRPSRDLVGPDGRRRKIVFVVLKAHPVQGRRAWPVTYYLDDDLAAMNRRRQEREAQKQPAPSEPYQDGNGVRWLTATQLQRIYGRSRDLARVWARTPSRIRPGEMALRSKGVPSPCRSGTVTGYHEGDWLDILAGKESSNPGVGRGVNASALRERRIREALAALPQIIPAGASRPRRDVLARAKADYRLGGQYVRAAFARLHGIAERRGRNGVSYVSWQLPPDAYASMAAGHADPPSGGGPAAASRPTAVERMRKVVREFPNGKTAKAGALIRAAKIKRQDGLAALKILKELGEYNGQV